MSPLIFYPSSLREALTLKFIHPSAIFLAGGLSLCEEHQSVQVPIIALKQVSELYRVNFLPNTIELGTMISLKSIMNKGRKFFPSLLLQAIESFVYYPVLEQATLGGNLASKRRQDLLSVLGLLDGSLELRVSKKSTWIRLSQFLSSKKEFTLKENEMATRLRIPISKYWTKEIFKKIPLPFMSSSNRVILCILLRMNERGILEDSIFLFDTEEEIFSLSHKELGLDNSCTPLSREANQGALEAWQSILSEREMGARTQEILYNLMKWALLALKI